MRKWIRQSQERSGTYFFSGQFVVTRSIASELSAQEIHALYLEIQQLVKIQGGLDYLQVFTNEQGQKLFFIDQLNQEMIESGKYRQEHNYCTLMFAHEY